MSAGLVGFVAGPASAHTWQVTHDCTAIEVDLSNYNTEVVNTITVVRGGVAETKEFSGGALAERFPFSGPLGAEKSYTVTVVAGDDLPVDGNGPADYSFTTGGTAPACPVPAVSITATSCDVDQSGGTGTVRAAFSSLVAGSAYDVVLLRDGAPHRSAVYTPYGTATTGSTQWRDLSEGGTYSVVVTEKSTGLSATSDAVTLAGCYSGGATVEITAEQCVVTGGDTAISVNVGGLVQGRAYRVALDGPSLPAQVEFVANGAVAPIPFTVPAGSGAYTASITDVAKGVSVSSSAVEIFPCPEVGGIALELDRCVYGQSETGLGITVSGLVPGRSYQVAVDGVDIAPAPFVAAAAAETLQVRVGNGSHTVTLRDVAAPGFVQSATTELVACPATPAVDLSATACTTEGGTSDLTVTPSALVAGRNYVVTLHRELDPTDQARVEVTGTQGPAEPIVFRDIAPGSDYTVVVSDADEPSASAEKSVSVEPCPRAAHIGMIADECNALGQGSDIHLDLFELVEGESYHVVLERLDGAGTGTEVDRIDDVVADGRLTFSGVPAGSDYRISVVGSDSTDILSPRIALHPCDVPGSGVGGVSVTADDVSPTPAPAAAGPADARPTLAQTGGEPVVPAVAALLVLLLGMATVGTGALRRRRSS